MTPALLDELIERSTAEVELRRAGYERWRATTHSGTPAVVERWPGSAGAAAASAAAARWLAGRAGTPRLLYHRDDVVVFAAVGRSARTLTIGDPPEAVGRAMGAALAELHAVPAGGCPRRLPRQELVALASRRVADGGVAADALRPAYARFGAQRLLTIATASAPPRPEEPVVTHGDCVVDNLLADPDSDGRCRGWLRLDGLAIADRHRDLARALKDLVTRFGAPAADAFLEAYGSPLDLLVLEFHALLDELMP